MAGVLISPSWRATSFCILPWGGGGVFMPVVCSCQQNNTNARNRCTTRTKYRGSHGTIIYIYLLAYNSRVGLNELVCEVFLCWRYGNFFLKQLYSSLISNRTRKVSRFCWRSMLNYMTIYYGMCRVISLVVWTGRMQTLWSWKLSVQVCLLQWQHIFSSWLRWAFGKSIDFLFF